MMWGFDPFQVVTSDVFKQIKCVNNTHKVYICEVFNKVASGVLRDGVQRLYRGIIYFQVSYGFTAHAKYNLLTLIRKVWPSLRRFSRNSHLLNITLRSSVSNLPHIHHEIWKIRYVVSGVWLTEPIFTNVTLGGQEFVKHCTEFMKIQQTV